TSHRGASRGGVRRAPLVHVGASAATGTAPGRTGSSFTTDAATTERKARPYRLLATIRRRATRRRRRHVPALFAVSVELHGMDEPELRLRVHGAVAARSESPALQARVLGQGPAARY